MIATLIGVVDDGNDSKGHVDEREEVEDDISDDILLFCYLDLVSPSG